jgi:hypothetical protein
MPILSVSFDTNSFIADHTQSKELSRAFMSTQLFESFVQMLLPGMYRQLHPSLLSGGLKGAAAANEAKALSAAAAALLTKEQAAMIGTVFDPHSEDKGFFTRLPSSIRLFNAAIAAKLNRLASSSLFGQRLGGARKLLLDTAFAEDTTNRLRLHIVINYGKQPNALHLANQLVSEGASASSASTGPAWLSSSSHSAGGVVNSNSSGEMQRWTTALAVALREAENIGITSAAYAEGAFDEVVGNENESESKNVESGVLGIEGGSIQIEGQIVSRQQQQQQQQQRGGTLSPRMTTTANAQGGGTKTSQLLQGGGGGPGGGATMRRKDLLRQASQRLY